MKKERAEQIVTSPVTIDVTYNGDLVYIEKVNPSKDTVSIHTFKQPQNTREVNVTQLIELENDHFS